ncbi:MAG: PAS domain-containing protein [Desulfobulbaceae bacterium]|nr:PAS domain-containing protein [Desulfobulbaceae bacterium]
MKKESDGSTKLENSGKQSGGNGKWGNTFDSITDFISIHDRDLKIVKVNKALVDFLETEPKKIIGKYCYKVMHGLMEPWPGCPHLEAIKAGKTVTKVVEDPTIGIPLQIRCCPYFDENGELTGSVHIARDITEQRKAELEKEQLLAKVNADFSNMEKMKGFLSICASCKKIKDEKGSWNHIESYFEKHLDVRFSHSICPECTKKLYPEFMD